MAATHNSAIPIEGGDNSQPEDPDALLQDSPEEGAEAGDEANPEDGDDTGMTDSSIDPREGLDGMLHDMEAQNEGVTSPGLSRPYFVAKPECHVLVARSAPMARKQI